MKKNLVFLVLTFLILNFSGCVSSSFVTIETNELGADVYIDGEYYGQTPISEKMSNGIWNDPVVLLKKEGFIDARRSLDKEIKPANLVLGVVLWWPSLLWVYGPDDYQYYELHQKSDKN